MQDPWPLLDRLASSGEVCAVATVIETRGSASARTGSKAVIDQHGKVIFGWVGGGCAQSTVCGTALECMRNGTTAIVDLNLDDEVLGTGMPCGGSMRVFVEPMLPRPVLWLLGHGAIAESICSFGAALGFRVVVDDPLAEAGRYPDAARLVTEDMDYGELKPGPADYVVVATQHKGDHHSMLKAVRSPCSFIALIASRKRARLVLEYLRQENIGEDELLKVHAPAGLDLGAETPAEIALSVLSEIILHRRHGTGSAKRLPAATPESKRPAAAARPSLAAVNG